uniref:inositol-polyphosphate 5-phosphatase n=1 Tax=Pundamilia nyererei TaxID=303518 RepID=A0A3B4FD91_9CICH
MHPPPPPPFCLRLSRRGIDGREGSAATAVVRVTKRGSHQLNVRQCFLSAELICQGDGQDLVFVLLTNQQMFNLKITFCGCNSVCFSPRSSSFITVNLPSSSAKKFRKVVGKETCSETLESTPTLEKAKFPQDYFPECKWSRKGFIRTRWAMADCAFDLVNIHLFHDASNLVAWEKSPSEYSGTRQKALAYVLDRITDQRYEKLPFFVFGDFNFRLDSKKVIEKLCSDATMQTIRTDNNEIHKLVFQETDNDRKVILQIEKKLFNYVNQEVFREDNGTSLLEFDKELSVFKERLHEQEIGFPPSYPYSEDSSQGKQYMNTRCPAWCDRILMSPSARDMLLKPENEEKSIVYDNIGPNVCMGDHKPVFLSFRITAGAGKPNANKHKCCVVQ